MNVDKLSSVYDPEEPLKDVVGGQYHETERGGEEAKSSGFCQSETLISQTLPSDFQTTRVTELTGEDAQCMVDFLDAILRENGGLGTNEGKYLLHLLRGLAKSAQVFPQYYKLKNIRCDFSQPREGGAFADIYEGVYENRKICLKAVRVFGKRDNDQLLRAHMKELILWAHLSHPNVLPFYGVYGCEGETQRSCIVAPWMSNGNLSDYLKFFPHSPRMELIADIAAGLAYLHQMEVVHGDLKGKNVLISNDGRALLADFGISRIMTTTGLASTQLANGTTRWKAPELLLGLGCNLPPTFESDIWSFGCLCYEVFTRKVPFYQHIYDAQLFAALIYYREIPLQPEGDQLDSVSDHMWGLMKRCWDYNPQNRPNCDEIRQFIVDVASPDAQHHVSLPLDFKAPPSWDTIRNKSKATIDHDRIHRILLRVGGTFSLFGRCWLASGQIPPDPHSASALRHFVVKLKPTYAAVLGPEKSSIFLGFFGRIVQEIKRKCTSIWEWK